MVTEEVQAHETRIEMVKPSPPEVNTGADIALRVQVSCPECCDLRGGIARIVLQDAAVVKETELTQFDGRVNETEDFVVKAPIEPGEYIWTAVFPLQQNEGVLHEESSAPFSFTVKPHATSIAVWDVPSPIAFSDKFSIKVGARCSAGCSLEGHKIEIYDHEAEEVATDTLGETVWPGTSALYWAEMELEAPGVEGYHSWTVKFPKPDLALPHEEASYRFGFTTTKPPEHVVTVDVIAQDTKSPIKNAHVVLRPQSGYPYRIYTDEGGVAKLEVPKGEYTLHASKGDDYERFQTMVEITDDASIKVELRFDIRPYR
jgi:hypothetical protein